MVMAYPQDTVQYSKDVSFIKHFVLVVMEIGGKDSGRTRLLLEDKVLLQVPNPC